MNTIKVTNIVELRTRKGTSESTAEVLGYYTVGDGGGGVFYWDNNSVLSDNGGTIFQVSNVTTGRWIRIFDMFINVRWFGAKVDGTTIDNIPINNSILYANSIGGRNVYFPEGTYLIDGTANVPINAYSTYGGIVLKSNVNIICDSGVTFNIKPNTAIGYSCFVGVDISNVSISGGFKIYGDRVGHVLGEFGHGISLFSCKNIKIDSVNIDNVWGDGIYSGLKQNNILNDECENLSITNVVITNYRRNGISITSGKQIYINNVSISTGGGQSVSFSAGIDLEPDYATTTIQNVLIENVYIKTTFNGFSTAATNSFSVDKITILNSYIDAGTATMTGAIDSTIVYNNCVIKGVNYNNYYSTFNDCSFYIDDTYTFSGQSYMFDEASALYNKLIFKNCKFEVKGSKLFFYKSNVSNTGQIVFEDCLITIEGLAYADFTSYLNIEGNLLMYNTKFKYIGSKASNYANGYRMGYTFNGIDQIFDNCEIDPILNQNLPKLTGKFSYNLTKESVFKTSAAAVNYGTRETLITFNRGDTPNSYLSKITGSFSGNDFDTTLNFALANSASTFKEVMTLTGSGKMSLGTGTPSNSAILELQSTTSGVLIPRMTTTDKNNITGVNGLMVYDTTLNKLCIFENSSWRTVTTT
jgi:hypothetical protein